MLDDPMTTALTSASLPTLAPRVVIPSYDRATLRRSIVHIGVGGFHRSHLATYVEEIAAAGDTAWGIVGIGVLPRDARMAEVLERQDGLYTLITRSAKGTRIEVIGSIVESALASGDPEQLIARIGHPDTQIVSLTITEGGYPIDDVTGAFLPERSGDDGVFAFLVAGLQRRRATGGGPLTVLSCDNILGNGDAARTATLGQAARVDEPLAGWIAESVSFPNSMVDRITPATTEADVAWLRSEWSIDDEWPVVAEPFRQWVIEDDFAGERLPLESLDVIVTDDIEPYESMKLRLLNAGHSCLAYLAALDGHHLVDRAMADPALGGFVDALLRVEAVPTLAPAPGIDPGDYVTSLIERFANPGVGDQIARLCIDGSAKFPKFLLPTVRAQLAADGPIERSVLALAAWSRYLATTPSPAPDPMLADAVGAALAARDDPAAFLRMSAVFGTDLPADQRFVDAFVTAHRSLDDGVDAAITGIA